MRVPRVRITRKRRREGDERLNDMNTLKRYTPTLAELVCGLCVICMGFGFAGLIISHFFGE